MISGLARTAVGTVLSRGAGYETLRRIPVRRPHEVDEYPIDYAEKTAGADPLENPSSTPAAVAQWGLGWWARSGACPPFLAAAEALLDRAVDTADGLRWFYDVPVPKYGLQGRWCSALAQGQAASVLVRASLATSDGTLAQAARRAVEPLLAESELVVLVPDGPTLEEAPSSPPSFILNGWILALLGLRDVSVGLSDPRAGTAFAAGTQALLARLPLYDLGWWTRYSLYPHSVVDLAKPIYHRFHVIQLHAMHDVTGLDGFASTARRWEGYDGRRGRLRALAQKGIYVARGGRRPNPAPARS